MSAQALIGFGQVRHARLKPTRHTFDYPTYFLMLPMRSLQGSPGTHLARNRRAASWRNRWLRAGCLRDGATPRRASVVGHAQCHPHPARGCWLCAGK